LPISFPGNSASPKREGRGEAGGVRKVAAPPDTLRLIKEALKEQKESASQEQQNFQ